MKFPHQPLTNPFPPKKTPQSGPCTSGPFPLFRVLFPNPTQPIHISRTPLNPQLVFVYVSQPKNTWPWFCSSYLAQARRGEESERRGEREEREQQQQHHPPLPFPIPLPPPFPPLSSPPLSNPSHTQPPPPPRPNLPNQLLYQKRYVRVSIPCLPIQSFIFSTPTPNPGSRSFLWGIREVSAGRGVRFRTGAGRDGAGRGGGVCIYMDIDIDLKVEKKRRAANFSSSPLLLPPVSLISNPQPPPTPSLPSPTFTFSFPHQTPAFAFSTESGGAILPPPPPPRGIHRGCGDENRCLDSDSDSLSS